jgi:D-lactate dehydrogenase (cytochrome)
MMQILSEAHLNFLRSVVGDEWVSTANADLAQHSRDQSFHQPHYPAAVVWPAEAGHVSAILKYANEHMIPVTPWGAGSSLEGNPLPVHGGIVLDMNRMDKILEVRAADFQVDVQPGVKYKDMNVILAKQGLFFAPDPGANASIGGMVANNAAGTRTPGYGATKDNVLRLEVVLASGDIIRIGSRSAKTSSGYDLVHLFVGSEGTLGVITEATLKLAPLPEKFSAAVAVFDSVEEATRAVSAIMGSGLSPVALEFLDPNMVRELNTTGEFTLAEKPTLLMEFHSASEAGLKEELPLVQAICESEGGAAFQAVVGREGRDRLWRMRYQTYEVVMRGNPGISFLILDIAAPVSKYPEMVGAARRAMETRGLRGYMVGHAGDGNLHPMIPYKPGDEASHELAEAANAEVVEAAIALGGTATGEHGVGIGKRRFMPLEHGKGLDVMRTIKNALDPNGILNPGKIL